MKYKFFLNALSVKRGSGGVLQIAINFVNQCLINKDPDISWFFLLSTDLYEMVKVPSEICYVAPAQPDYLNSYSSVQRDVYKLEYQHKPSTIYTIASPSYMNFNATEVMRFTNPWVTHPNKYAIEAVGCKTSIRQLFYVLNAKRIIKKRRYFITQTMQCKAGLLKITKTNKANIKVVPNVLPKIYLQTDRDSIIHRKINKVHKIHCISVSAATPHKNIEIIVDIIKLLKSKYTIDNIYFHITIPKTSTYWSKLNQLIKNNNLEDIIINHGYVSQEDLIMLYKNMHICFFPSLLEVFSASLLEAMYFKLPIVASNLEFNTEIAQNAALYYEPANANDAADKLYKLINNIEIQDKLVRESARNIFQYLDYESHYNQIIEFLKEVSSRK